MPRAVLMAFSLAQLWQHVVLAGAAILLLAPESGVVTALRASAPAGALLAIAGIAVVHRGTRAATGNSCAMTLGLQGDEPMSGG
ncbi:MULTISPECIES: hypothetical protein [Amycolatopsis]|uniref:Uncharacterized protein n=1 Tax=Amycolatopsis echigonensis TaxID=2576905 RepID=A0A8E1VYK4_9PSEU|nr:MULTISPECIES: hypothetical protein [Amycolatopsis]MBB2500784.1 hypothetical protein [Amycolatopsis echigonensis]MCG3751259.1 hypothetical protein [Amycolatopsis sp. Poz14]